MIFNQIKYKWLNNNIEITAKILSSMAWDRYWLELINISP